MIPAAKSSAGFDPSLSWGAMPRQSANRRRLQSRSEAPPIADVEKVCGRLGSQSRLSGGGFSRTYNLSQHKVRARREVAHICASRFELIKMVQAFISIGAEREASHDEASDDCCFRVCRSIRRRDHYEAISSDRAVCQN